MYTCAPELYVQQTTLFGKTNRRGGNSHGIHHPPPNGGSVDLAGGSHRITTLCIRTRPHAPRQHTKRNRENMPNPKCSFDGYVISLRGRTDSSRLHLSALPSVATLDFALSPRRALPSVSGEKMPTSGFRCSFSRYVGCFGFHVADCSYHARYPSRGSYAFWVYPLLASVVSHHCRCPNAGIPRGALYDFKALCGYCYKRKKCAKTIQSR